MNRGGDYNLGLGVRKSCPWLKAGCLKSAHNFAYQAWLLRPASLERFLSGMACRAEAKCDCHTMDSLESTAEGSFCFYDLTGS